ncbi:hypothetical protein [Pseudomonas corrugata]|uniref:hypothetical protein n=1 Tax=Pseudomonas corrugata TaxID=47879 RepID=UPI0018E5ACA9|nr:hypothetical protein [Pseudomonas corrugata]
MRIFKTLLLPLLLILSLIGVDRPKVSPVGTRLLAKAVVQPALMLDAPPFSRAGALPQGAGVIRRLEH